MALTIGKYINYALTQSDELTAKVNGNIFPVVCPDIDSTPTPYVIYWTEGMQEQSTKDGIYGDTATVKIMVVAKDYDEKMDVLPLVRTALTAGFTAWNALEGITFEVADQTMSLEADQYDVEFGYHTSTMSYEIQTDEI